MMDNRDELVLISVPLSLSIQYETQVEICGKLDTVLGDNETPVQDRCKVSYRTQMFSHSPETLGHTDVQIKAQKENSRNQI